MKLIWMIIGLIALLLLASIIVPSNTLTGNVVKDQSCGSLGCSELCDQGSANTCNDGMVCCSTHWNSGVCDFEGNCEKVREYSVYQTLETYQDSMRTREPEVQADAWRFFVPMTVCLGILGYFAIRRGKQLR